MPAEAGSLPAWCVAEHSGTDRPPALPDGGPASIYRRTRYQRCRLEVLMRTSVGVLAQLGY